MKKFLFLSVLLVSLMAQAGFAQVPPRKIGPAEQKITDSICNCVVKLDMSKITTKDEATAAYTDCVMQHADMLAALSAERHVELTDKQGMTAVGVDIALNLMNQNCKGFKELAMLLGGQDASDDDAVSTASGTLKRVETRGFNYFVLNDRENKESSFIWLKQFPGSEQFMGNTDKYIGKKLSIKYKELEVYLPQAKGYYKVKEITAITILWCCPAKF